MSKFGRVVKMILLWALVAVTFVLSLVFMPSDGSLCGMVTILLLLPIDKWQNLIGKVLKGKVKAIVCIIMVIATFGNFPVASTNDSVSAPQEMAAVTTAEPTGVPELTAEPEPTPEPTAEPVPEFTGESMVESTQAPTPKPTIKPTPKPTKAPALTQAPAPAETPAPVPAEAPIAVETLAPVEGPTPTEAPAPVEDPAPQPEKATAPVEEQQLVSEKAPERDYVYSAESNKFHTPGCRHVKKITAENRRDVHASRDDLIAKGYSPCGTCKP